MSGAAMAATAPSMVAGYRLLLPLQHLPARPAFLPLSTPDPDKSLLDYGSELMVSRGEQQ
jgi:hypothetical protein